MIEIDSISKRYRVRNRDHSLKLAMHEAFRLKERSYVQALNEINLEIKKGEIFGILGPNGAGKTTLLKIIAGFLIPERGEVKVNGYDIIKDRRSVRLSVNFLRAGGWVIFDYKYPIDKLLEFWGIFMGLKRNEAKKNVDFVLDIVGLVEKKKEFPENLSSGQLQRLNLARCLMAPRPLYLLDEATVNIDPYSANFIREYVRNKLANNGVTVVLATHNMWEAEMMCDRIAILNRGKIIKIGSPKEIKKGIGKQALILELDSYPDALLNEIEGISYVSGASMDGNHLYVYGDELRPKIIEITDLCRRFTNIKYVDLTEPSLNEIFMKIIKEEDS